VSALRPELQTILESLLSASVAGGEVSLDTLGDAIGAKAVSFPEVEALIAQLEAAGRKVIGSLEDLRGEEHLKAVITSVRSLRASLGRKPSMREIALHAGLSLEQVRHALSLAKIMQR
jgi:hypothetical protein